jgi:hypothetical protein
LPLLFTALSCDFPNNLRSITQGSGKIGLQQDGRYAIVGRSLRHAF